MNCAVCLDDYIEVNIHYMECLHFLCDECFSKLQSNSCPLCRHEITLLNSSSNDFSDSEIDLEEQDDDFIIHIRRDRQEIKRKKYQKKKQNLNFFLHQIATQSHSTINIPNKKKRFQKKISHIQF